MMTLCDSCAHAGRSCEIWPQHELLRCAEFRHRPLTVKQSTGKSAYDMGPDLGHVKGCVQHDKDAND